MSQKLISLRVELSKRLADAQVVGRSRELSLAVTSIQSARMLFGSVALILGSVNPYPEADKPASAVIHPSADLAVDYVPPVPTPEGQVGYVKGLRVQVQLAIDAAVALRSELWARPYASAISITAEVLFDRALTELFLAKQWLGEQLAVIAGHALVKPAKNPEAANAAAAQVDKLWDEFIARLEDSAMLVGSDGRISFGKAPEDPKKIEMANGSSIAFCGEGTPGNKLMGSDAALLAGDASASPLESAVLAAAAGETVDLAAAAKQHVDDTIVTHLALGGSVTEICRALDVTEYRVNKIRKERAAEIEAKKVESAAAAEKIESRLDGGASNLRADGSAQPVV